MLIDQQIKDYSPLSSLCLLFSGVLKRVKKMRTVHPLVARDNLVTEHAEIHN